MGIVNDTDWNTRSQKFDSVSSYTFATAEPNWSTLLEDYGIVGDGKFEFDVRFTNAGKQKFRTSADGAAYFYIDGVFQFAFQDEASATISTTPTLYEKNTVHRITIIANNTDRGLTGVAAEWTGYEYSYVNITSFTNAAYIESGGTTVPTSKRQLSWDVENARAIFIDNNVGEVTGLSSPKTVETYLQSSYPGASPAQKIYKLTAYGYAPDDIQTAFTTVNIRNDNVFEYFEQGESLFYEIPSFLDLNDNDEVVRYLGKLRGIDMEVSLVSVNSDFTIALQNDIASYSTSVNMGEGNDVYIKFNVPPYSVDENGEQNITEYVLDIGPVRKYFYVGRKAPDFTIDADFPDVDTSLPYPKIDTTALTPSEYTTTSIPSSVTSDLELSTPYGPQIRTDIQSYTEGHIPGTVEVRIIPPNTSEAQKANIPFKEPNNFYDDINDERRLLKSMNLDSIKLRNGTNYNLTGPNQIRIRQGNVTLTAFNVKE